MQKILDLRREKTRYMVFFLMTSLILPSFYHSIGLSGVKFLPIFLSLVVGSIFLGKRELSIMAILTPVINMALFNMPTGIMTYILIFEGIVFALIGDYIKNIFFRILISRFSTILLTFFISTYSFQIWKANFILGITGILINGILGFYIEKNIKTN